MSFGARRRKLDFQLELLIRHAQHWTKTGIEILWNAGLMLWMEIKIILVVESMILGLSGSLYNLPLQSGHIFPCIMENRQHMA